METTSPARAIARKLDSSRDALVHRSTHPASKDAARRSRKWQRGAFGATTRYP
jgi:hypothetical protein